MKGIGISINPPKNAWRKWDSCDQSIIIFGVSSGKIYGGLDAKETIKNNVYQNSDVEYEMKLDLPNRKFVINSHNILIETTIGDFHYSPIVIFSRTDNKIDLL